MDPAWLALAGVVASWWVIPWQLHRRLRRAWLDALARAVHPDAPPHAKIFLTFTTILSGHVNKALQETEYEREEEE